MNDYENLRAVDTRWTPLTDEVRDVIDSLQREGGTWRAVSAASGLKTRYIRRLRQRKPQRSGKKVVQPLKSVSYSTLDKLLARSDKVHVLQSLPWYTVEEMCEMGLWDEPLPHMKQRPESVE